LALGATACAGATRSKTAALKAMATSSFLSMGTTSGGVSRMLAGHPGVSRSQGSGVRALRDCGTVRDRAAGILQRDTVAPHFLNENLAADCEACGLPSTGASPAAEGSVAIRHQAANA
jgi:hypothetical protein